MVLLSLSSCGTPRAVAPHAAGDDPGVVWRYEVKVGPTLELDVDAVLSNATEKTPLRVDEDAARFVDRTETRDGGRVVRYHVRLEEAARALHDVDVAYATEGVVFAPPSTWLMRPAGVPAIGRYRFHVTKPDGVAFVTGIRPAKDGAADTYEAEVVSLEDASFAAFGALRTARIPGTEVDVAWTRGLVVPPSSIVRWLTVETSAVASYFGARDRVVLFVAPSSGEETRGKTLGDGGAAVLLRLGTNVTEANLLDDWVAAHELVHVAMPAVAPEHAWFAEGLATYVEPILRARAGLISPESVWSDLVTNLPDGLPKPNDGGLDGAHERERVYWGGALYFLLADVAIRERTGGARSLDDALVGIKRTGTNVEVHWPLARVIEEGDRATGTTVLAELHRAFARKAYAPDLNALFHRLGVRRVGESVVFDDEAPHAAIRMRITARLPSNPRLR